MCLKVKLTGLLRLVLVVLGSKADTTVDIMVLLVFAFVLKRVGLRMFVMLV